jgi:multiple sugar transport system ATP-binding protein
VVKHIERLGADTILHLDVSGLPSLVVRTDGDRPIAVGEMLFASPVAGKEHSFV